MFAFMTLMMLRDEGPPLGSSWYYPVEEILPRDAGGSRLLHRFEERALSSRQERRDRVFDD